MPYLSADKVKNIRDILKQKYPKYKFSITRSDHSGVSIALMESNIDFSEFLGVRGHAQLNQWTIDSDFKDNPKAMKFWKDVYSIANEGNGTLVNDGDYGNVPRFYVWLAIGKWDKPYVYTGAKKAQPNTECIHYKNEYCGSECSMVKVIAVQKKAEETFVPQNTSLKHEATGIISLNKIEAKVIEMPITYVSHTTKMFTEFANDLTSL
jgi:hypothetical protein